MAATLAAPKPAQTAPPIVKTLGFGDIPSLRLPGARGAQGVRQIVERNPGRSLWIPSTLEYALLTDWRNRPEITYVEELVAVANAERLLRAAFERCVASGADLLLAIELEAPRSISRYERAGLEMLEEVITYQTVTPRRPWAPRRGVRFVPVQSGDERALDVLTRIDRDAFPWLWYNSRAEFDVYLETAGVEVALLEADGEPTGYVGLTLFPAWGHIDRIAIAPSQQGRGFGREALGLAVDVMRQRGARHVALSTQRSNLRSQRLYEGFGFERTPEMDYWLFGAWCNQERADTLVGIS